MKRTSRDRERTQMANLALELGARVVAPEYPGYGLLDAFACSPEVPPLKMSIF